MFGTFLRNAVTTIGPMALQYGKEALTKYVSKRLGDLGTQSQPPKTVAQVRQQKKDTVGNLRDIQTRLSVLQKQCQRQYQKQAMRSRSMPRPSYIQQQGDWQDQGGYEQVPRQMIKQSYEADFDF